MKFATYNTTVFLLLLFLFTPAHSTDITEEQYPDTVSAHIILNNDQNADIGLLDTAGIFIRYLRNGQPVNCKKSFIAQLIIGADTVVFAQPEPAVISDTTLPLPLSAEQTAGTKQRPRSISSEKFYQDKFPELFQQYNDAALTGEVLNYLGIALQIASPLIAETNVWAAAGTGLGGSGCSILGSHIAIRYNLHTINLLYQAKNCKEVNTIRFVRAKRAINVLYTLGGIFSFIGPPIVLGSKNTSSTSATYSLSPISLIISGAAGIAQIITIRRMRATVNRMNREWQDAK
jgi:hypothetical protein